MRWTGIDSSIGSDSANRHLVAAGALPAPIYQEYVIDAESKNRFINSVVSRCIVPVVKDGLLITGQNPESPMR